MKNSAALSILAFGAANATLLKSKSASQIMLQAMVQPYGANSGPSGDGWHAPTTWKNPEDGILYEYGVISQGEPWEKADEYCRRFDGELTTIRNAEESAVINSLQLDPRREHWIAGSDREVEGVWAWKNGEPMNYTNWSPNEPGTDAHDARDCIFMWAPSKSNNRWGDAMCGHSLPFVCRRHYKPRPEYQHKTREAPEGSTDDTVADCTGDDCAIGTKMNVRVGYNLGITVEALKQLDALEVAGGHHEGAEEEETILTQVDAETEDVPDGITRMNLKIPYNLQMADHGEAALDSLEAKAGLV